MLAGIHECGQLSPPYATSNRLTDGRAVGPIESLSERGDRDAVPTP